MNDGDCGIFGFAADHSLRDFAVQPISNLLHGPALAGQREIHQLVGQMDQFLAPVLGFPVDGKANSVRKCLLFRSATRITRLALLKGH